jgi:hypothetical protein
LISPIASCKKVLHLNDPALSFVKCFKGGEGLIQLEEIIRALFGEGYCLIESDSSRAASAFGAIVALCMIDEYAPHHLSRDSHKMGAVLPLNLFLINEPKVCLIYQRGGLQCVILALASEIARRDGSQLGVHEGHQLVQRRRVTVTPVFQQSCDFAR